MFDKVREQVASLASTLQLALDNRLKEVHTSLPGIVVSFDSVKQTASVQPAIKRIFRKDTGSVNFELTPMDLPLCINVPVRFPRGGGYSITLPVQAGDECLLEFCERSIDHWFKFGGTREPGAKRFHSLSDAVCVVGLSSEPNAIPNFDTTGIELKKDDGTSSILIKGNEVDITTTTQVTINSPLTHILNDLQVDGVTTLGATVTSNGKDISDTHTHIGSPTAPAGPVSNTGVPL